MMFTPAAMLRRSAAGNRVSPARSTLGGGTVATCALLSDTLALPETARPVAAPSRRTEQPPPMLLQNTPSHSHAAPQEERGPGALSHRPAQAAFGAALDDDGWRARLAAFSSQALAKLSDVAASAFVLAALALTARALGLVEFGMFALIVTFTHGVARLLRPSPGAFEPTALAAGGVGASIDADNRDAPRLVMVKSAFLADLVAGGAAFAVIFCIAGYGAPLLGWTSDVAALVQTYAFVAIFTMQGAARTVLARADRKAFASRATASATAIRAALSAFGFWAGWDLYSFVAAWALTTSLAGALIIAAALSSLEAAGLAGVWRAAPSGPDTLAARVQRSISIGAPERVRAATRYLDVLMIGALVGPSAAGAVHLAKNVARFALQPAYHRCGGGLAEMARAASRRDGTAFDLALAGTRASLATVSLLIVGAVLLAAPYVATFLFGGAYGFVAQLISVQTAAAAFALNAAPPRVALATAGREPFVFKLAVITTATFIGAIFVLAPIYGAAAAPAAHVVHCSLWLVALIVRRRFCVRPAV